MPTWTGAVSTDWNTAGNWSTPSAVPTAATAAIFTGTPTRNCTTGTANRTCLSLDTTGYNGTLEIGSSTAGTLTVSGNVTLGSTVGHITGLANLIMAATGTLDVATGVTIPNLGFAAASNIVITQTRTFTVTNISKGGFNNATVNPVSGTMSINLTNGTYTATAGIFIINSNITFSINGSCSFNSASIVCNLVQASGSTLTLVSGLAFGGASTFNCSAGTFVPNGQTVTFPNAVVTVNMGSNSFYNLGGGGGIGFLMTMQSNINVTNNFAPTGTSQANGAFDITVGGQLSTGGGGLTNSTAGRKITVTGTSTGVATITSASSSNIILEIDCGSNGFTLTGTLTFFSVNYLATNSGIFTITGSTLAYGNNLTINMNGSTNSWNVINNTTGLARTITLLSDVYCTTFGVTSNGDVINGSGYFVNISSSTNTMSNISGTGGLKFVGSSNATWNQTAGTVNSIAAIVFAKTGGATLNIPNSFTYTGTTGITYTSGVINHTATLTLGTTTLNTSSSGMSWNNLTINAGATITINQPLSITSNLLLSGTTTFTGSAGWTCGNLICSTAGRTITLANSSSGASYRTTTNTSLAATAASPIIMTSDNATTRSIWTLDNGAAQSLVYVNGTRIDSSGGQTIWSFGATLTNTVNWGIGSRPGTSAYTFVN